MLDRGGRWGGLVDLLSPRWAAVQPSARDLALFPERNPGPVLLLARDGGLLYSNPAARRDSDLQPVFDRALPGSFGERVQRVWASGSAEGAFEYALGGRVLSCRVLLLPERQVAHVYLTDVTEARTAELQIAHARGHDALTGLGNRVAFEARLEQALLDRPKGRVVALVLNLDRMRRVNETLGHAAGDSLLSGAAARLHRAARSFGASGGEAFRLDGDSFALLLTTTTPDATPARLARTVQAALGEPFALSAREVFVTASLGIAVAPADGHSSAALLRAAETALDQVKQRGGNGFRCYAPELDAMAREFLEVETGLHRALERNELFLVYQTQVELASSRETGREALLRWRHPQHGLVLPGRFIPVAEETGSIAQIGEWASRQACLAAACWNHVEQTPPRVAVNVTARQLHDPRFYDGIAATLEETGLAPARLELEITESAAMADPEAVAGTLRRLRALGVGIAIDDFGTGYSSLSYLGRFPASRIKIDRSFVQGIGRAPEAEGITRAVIDVAQRLGMSVLAEGVETEEQARALRGWGCEEAQGFLFGHPFEDALCGAAAWSRG